MIRLERFRGSRAAYLILLGSSIASGLLLFSLVVYLLVAIWPGWP